MKRLLIIGLLVVGCSKPRPIPALAPSCRVEMVLDVREKNGAYEVIIYDPSKVSVQIHNQ